MSPWNGNGCETSKRYRTGCSIAGPGQKAQRMDPDAKDSFINTTIDGRLSDTKPVPGSSVDRMSH